MNLSKQHIPGLALAIELARVHQGSDLESMLSAVMLQAEQSLDSSYQELLAQIDALNEEIEPLRKDAEEKALQEARANRLEYIVDLLFPSYSPFIPEAEIPIRHPARSWWWNGASLIEHEHRRECIRIEVSSYVGGGNTDTFECDIPNSWMDAEDPKTMIYAWCIEEKAKINAASKAKEIRDAQYAIEQNAKRLAQLTGK